LLGVVASVKVVEVVEDIYQEVELLPLEILLL
jgi:hypothetical protein